MAVFGLALSFAFFAFFADVLPVPFFLGGVLLYSGLLDLLDLADCFEQAAFYSLLVALETLDDCWAVEVVVDYGAELDFGVGNVVGDRVAAIAVDGGVDSGVVGTGIAFVLYKACEYDLGVGERVFRICVF